MNGITKNFLIFKIKINLVLMDNLFKNLVLRRNMIYSIEEKEKTIIYFIDKSKIIYSGIIPKNNIKKCIIYLNKNDLVFFHENNMYNIIFGENMRKKIKNIIINEVKR